MNTVKTQNFSKYMKVAGAVTRQCVTVACIKLSDVIDCIESFQSLGASAALLKVFFFFLILFIWTTCFEGVTKLGTFERRKAWKHVMVFTSVGSIAVTFLLSFLYPAFSARLSFSSDPTLLLVLEPLFLSVFQVTPHLGRFSVAMTECPRHSHLSRGWFCTFLEI